MLYEVITQHWPLPFPHGQSQEVANNVCQQKFLVQEAQVLSPGQLFPGSFFWAGKADKYPLVITSYSIHYTKLYDRLETPIKTKKQKIIDLSAWIFVFLLMIRNNFV